MIDDSVSSVATRNEERVMFFEHQEIALPRNAMLPAFVKCV
jgi:hypothetical protein